MMTWDIAELKLRCIRVIRVSTQSYYKVNSYKNYFKAADSNNLDPEKMKELIETGEEWNGFTFDYQ